MAWTQGGKKTLAKKKQTSLVPDLQAALERSQSEAAAVAAIPFDAVMAVTYTGSEDMKMLISREAVLSPLGGAECHFPRQARSNSSTKAVAFWRRWGCGHRTTRAP